MTVKVIDAGGAGAVLLDVAGEVVVAVAGSAERATGVDCSGITVGVRVGVERDALHLLLHFLVDGGGG